VGLDGAPCPGNHPPENCDPGPRGEALIIDERLLCVDAWVACQASLESERVSGVQRQVKATMVVIGSADLPMG
jgi:hypothetical protein